MLLKLLINPKSMIFSLVLGFEDKKIKTLFTEAGKVSCYTGFSYCSISRQA